MLNVMRCTACKIQFVINIMNVWGSSCYCLLKNRRSCSQRFDSRCWTFFRTPKRRWCLPGSNHRTKSFILCAENFLSKLLV